VHYQVNSRDEKGLVSAFFFKARGAYSPSHHSTAVYLRALLPCLSAHACVCVVHMVIFLSSVRASACLKHLSRRHTTRSGGTKVTVRCGGAP
jgi:hypothetical protein